MGGYRMRCAPPWLPPGAAAAAAAAARAWGVGGPLSPGAGLRTLHTKI